METLIVLSSAAGAAAAITAIVRMLGYGTPHVEHATVRVLEHGERLLSEMAYLRPGVGRHLGGIQPWSSHDSELLESRDHLVG